MLNVGGGELLIILLLALIVLGPQKLPEAARTIGKVVSEARKISSGFQREFKAAMDDPVAAAMRDHDDTKTLPPVADGDPVHTNDSPFDNAKSTVTTDRLADRPDTPSEGTPATDEGEPDMEPAPADTDSPSDQPVDAFGIDNLVAPQTDVSSVDDLDEGGGPPMPSDR